MLYMFERQKRLSRFRSIAAHAILLTCHGRPRPSSSRAAAEQQVVRPQPRKSPTQVTSDPACTRPFPWPCATQAPPRIALRLVLILLVLHAVLLELRAAIVGVVLAVAHLLRGLNLNLHGHDLLAGLPN